MSITEIKRGMSFDCPRQNIIIAGIVLTSGLMGVGIPFYVGAMGDDKAHMMVLPALVLLGFLLMFNRVLLLVLILLFRASGDVVLASTKFDLGSVSLGIGGLINAFVILIALLLVIEKPGECPKKIFAMWSFFLLAGLYGVMIAPSKSEAVRMYLGMISNFAIVVSSFYVSRSMRGFGLSARLVIWSSILPVFYALFEIFMNEGGFNGFRLKSTFAHPNIFAFYLTLVIALTLYVLKSQGFALSVVKRSGLGIYLFVLLALLLLTQTRSAWVACFTLFLLYGLYFERRYLIYLILVPFLAMLIPSVQERLLDLGSGNQYVQYAKLNSFAWRLLMWETGLKWMQPARYLLGYGGEAFSHYSTTFFPLSGGSHMGAHSVYVQLFFEVGAVGLTAFLWLFGRILWTLRPIFSIDRLAGLTTVVLIVEYLLVSISDNVLHYLVFNWYFWFIVGAALATLSFHEENARLGDRASGSARQGLFQSVPADAK